MIDITKRYPMFDYKITKLEEEDRIELGTVVRFERYGIWFDLEIRDIWALDKSSGFEEFIRAIQSFLYKCKVTSFMYQVTQDRESRSFIEPSKEQRSEQVMILERDPMMSFSTFSEYFNPFMIAKRLEGEKDEIDE